MAQITWRNINAPEFSAANSMFDAGAARLQSSLTGLEAIGVAGNEIVQQNWDKGVELNTQDLVNQLYSATTPEQLRSVDIAQFGAQVDPAAFNAALVQQTNTLRDADFKQTQLDLQQASNQLQQDQLDQADRHFGITQNDWSYHTGPDGQMVRMNKQGDVEQVYKFAVADKNTGKGGAKDDKWSADQWALIQQALRMEDDFTDGGEYGTNANKFLSDSGLFTPNDLKVLGGDIDVHWNKTNPVSKEIETAYTANTQTAQNNLRASLSAQQNLFNEGMADGASIAVMELQNGKGDLATVQKNFDAGLGKELSLLSGDMLALFTARSNGRQPTAEEMQHIYATYTQNVNNDVYGMFNMDSASQRMQTIIDNYFKQITNPENVKVANTYRNSAQAQQRALDARIAATGKEMRRNQVRINRAIRKGEQLTREDLTMIGQAPIIATGDITEKPMNKAVGFNGIALDKGRTTAEKQQFAEKVTGTVDTANSKFGIGKLSFNPMAPVDSITGQSFMQSPIPMSNIPPETAPSYFTPLQALMYNHGPMENSRYLAEVSAAQKAEADRRAALVEKLKAEAERKKKIRENRVTSIQPRPF